MSKPNNPKCATCFVVNNYLRCWCCKYRTKEWERENTKPVMITGEGDLYKPKVESGVEE
jgi:hypothetical protein